MALHSGRSKDGAHPNLWRYLLLGRWQSDRPLHFGSVPGYPPVIVAMELLARKSLNTIVCFFSSKPWQWWHKGCIFWKYSYDWVMCICIYIYIHVIYIPSYSYSISSTSMKLHGQLSLRIIDMKLGVEPRYGRGATCGRSLTGILRPWYMWGFLNWRIPKAMGILSSYQFPLGNQGGWPPWEGTNF